MDVDAGAYRTLFEAAPAALAVVAPDTGRVAACNDAFGDLTGREASGETLASLGADGAADVRAALEDADASGPVRWAVRTGDGVVTWTEARTSTATVSGETVHLLALRRAAEPDAAAKARAMEAAPVGVTMTDPGREDNPLVYANEAFERLTGYAESAATGRNCRFLQGEATDPRAVATLSRAIDAAEPATVELRNYRRDGTEFWNRVTVAPVTDEEGGVTHYVGFQEDVTERHRSKQELALARELLETVPSGVFRTEPTPDGTFEFANPALASLLGADSVAALRGRRVADFYVDPAVRTALVEALRASDGGPVRREVELEALDGERRDVLVTATLATDEAGEEHVHKVLQDITERRERERRLERYERLVENLPIGVYQNTPGPRGTFTFVNGAMVDLFEAETEGELRETPVSDLYADPEERATFTDRLRERGVVTEHEVELETLRGNSLWGSVTAIAREVDGGVVFDGVVQDVTERKFYERRIEEQRDDLDVLNRMLRHDIRNDLQVVTAYSSTLEDHVDETGAEYLETIQARAAEAVELTETARDVAEVMLSTDADPGAVALRPAVEGEVESVRSTDSEAVVTVEGAVPSVSVRGNDMLGSVFRNLLTNAVRHNDAAVPEVSVRARADEETVTVRVADNGPGVPEDQRETVFGKGEKGLESAGSGIGLYLVRTLVDRYGGDVWVTDSDAGGAAFVVELPRAGSD